jgi:hypothetical protein
MRPRKRAPMAPPGDSIERSCHETNRHSGLTDSSFSQRASRAGMAHDFARPRPNDEVRRAADVTSARDVLIHLCVADGRPRRGRCPARYESRPLGPRAGFRVGPCRPISTSSSTIASPRPPGLSRGLRTRGLTLASTKGRTRWSPTTSCPSAAATASTTSFQFGDAAALTGRRFDLVPLASRTKRGLCTASRRRRSNCDDPALVGNLAERPASESRGRSQIGVPMILRLFSTHIHRFCTTK